MMSPQAHDLSFRNNGIPTQGIIYAVRIAFGIEELVKRMMLTELKRELENAGERLTKVRDYL